MQGALDVGEERVAAQPGAQPDPAADGPDRAVEADREVRGDHLAGRFELAGRRAGGVPGGPGCAPFSYSEKVKVNATSAWLSPSVSMLIR